VLDRTAGPITIDYTITNVLHQTGFYRLRTKRGTPVYIKYVRSVQNVPSLPQCSRWIIRSIAQDHSRRKYILEWLCHNVADCTKFFVVSHCSFFFASISRVIYSIVEVELKNEVGHHPWRSGGQCFLPSRV